MTPAAVVAGIGRFAVRLLVALHPREFRRGFGDTVLTDTVADIDRVVHVFDPDDYARYTSGVYVPTQQIRSRRR